MCIPKADPDRDAHPATVPWLMLRAMVDRRGPGESRRRAISLAIAFIAVLMLTLAPSRSRAEDPETRIERYELDVTPRDDGTAAYRMLLTYGNAQNKDDGFKFVGKNSVTHLHAVDPTGKNLGAVATRPDSSGQTKIVFSLEPARAATRTAIVTFDQELEIDEGFDSATAAVPWAPNFRLVVARTIVRLHGDRIGDADGFTCTGRGASRVCVREQISETFPVKFGWRTNHLAFWAELIGAAVLWLVLALTIVKKKYDQFLETRGVIPTIEREAYPELVSGGYRQAAPAPEIPRGGDVKPELLSWDVSAIRQRVVAAAIMTFAPAIFAWCDATPFATPFVSAVVYAFFGLLYFAFLVLREKPFVTWWILPGVVSILAACAEQAPKATIPVFIVGVNVVIWGSIIAGAKSGGGSGSSGSTNWMNSGGSSFGSSGGSSCGGGGGSSCGGGGGGGGGCGG